MASPEFVAVTSVVGIAAGVVGAFALMRRMSLAADALSHVALPGIAVALLLRANIFLGAIVALVLGAILVWTLERRTQFATDTAVGVIFSAALALGALMTTREELIDALFGGGGAPSRAEALTGFVLAAGVIAFCLIERSALVITFLSEDIARSSGVRVRRLTFCFLIAFAVTVALGLRYLGALLMGSLMIIPAATARQLARNLREMFVYSILFAVAAMVGGAATAERYRLVAGPVIVAVATLLFLPTLAARRGRNS